jgi:Protein of unknown function (DUF3096)
LPHAECVPQSCGPAGRIAFAAKSGKGKTGYMPFGTRWKIGRDSLVPRGDAQVFASFFRPRQVVAGALCSISSIQTNRASRPISRGETMTIDPVLINPLIALIAGILILLMPRLLNYVVAIYLIAIGIIGLAHHFQ